MSVHHAMASTITLEDPVPIEIKWEPADFISIHDGFPESYAGFLWEWMTDPAKANFDDFSAPIDFADFVNSWWPRRVTERMWAIRYEGINVGYLGFAPQSPIAGQFHGLAIAPSFRRHGVGRAAMRLAIDALKAEGFRSFLSMPFADNFAIKKLLLKVGFNCIGTLPGAAQRDGKPLGVSVFHLYKGEA